MPSQEQLNHEKFTGEKIVSLIGEALRFDRFGDPQQMEPDLIFSNGCKVGIEVTTAYYHGDPDDPNFHARDEWQFARNPTFDEHGVHRPIDPTTGRPRVWDRMDERLTTSCQLQLHEKCSKRYEGIDRLWLAIYTVGRVTESYEYDLIIQKLTIPKVNPFERIFILHVVIEPRGGYRALQLFPNICSFYSH
jgi:hypothetical protein